MDYMQSNQQATLWRRAGSILINNPLPDKGTPSISFEEQDCIGLPDGKVVTTAVNSFGGPLSVQFDPAAQIDLINPADGTSLNKTMSHVELQIALYSVYMAAAKQRDEKLAAQAAALKAAQDAASFAEKNPVPVLTFAQGTQINIEKDTTFTNVAVSNIVNGAAGAITYASNDENIVTVDAAGSVTGVGLGTVMITATQAASLGVNAEGKAVYNVTVVAPAVVTG